MATPKPKPKATPTPPKKTPAKSSPGARAAATQQKAATANFKAQQARIAKATPPSKLTKVQQTQNFREDTPGSRNRGSAAKPAAPKTYRYGNVAGMSAQSLSTAMGTGVDPKNPLKRILRGK